MRKLKFLLLLITLLVLTPSNIKAACSSQDKARLKQIVSNINVSYDYEIKNNTAIFSIKFNNLSPEMSLRDPSNNYYRVYDWENNELVLDNYVGGKSYSFRFYGIDTCGGEEISNVYVTLPTYNYYHKLTVCDDAKEYKLCQKWVSHSLTRSEFIEKVEEYKNKNEIIDDSEVNKTISVIDIAMSFIRLYGIYIVIVIAIIIIVVKFIRYKKDTFGF